MVSFLKYQCIPGDEARSPQPVIDTPRTSSDDEESEEEKCVEKVGAKEVVGAEEEVETLRNPRTPKTPANDEESGMYFYVFEIFEISNVSFLKY